MKAHVVREQFSLDGKDYYRGTEITDPAEIAKVKAVHAHHLIQQHHEAVTPKPAPKADTADAMQGQVAEAVKDSAAPDKSPAAK